MWNNTDSAQPRTAALRSGSRDTSSDADGVVEEDPHDRPPSAKRRRVEQLPRDIDEGSGDGAQQPSSNGDGQSHARAAENDLLPYFKPLLENQDDRGENDCFFDTCVARSGVFQYLIKHFMEKHGLIRADQGRTGGGRRKTPKYLTLCPGDWPFNHGSTSSCPSCIDIARLRALVDDPAHEGPAVCSFCWSLLPTRHALVNHIDVASCRSYEGFPGKLALVREMYAAALRLPGAEEISRAAAGQRQAHVEAEQAARREKWQLEASLQQKAQEHWKQLLAERRRQRYSQPQQEQHEPQVPIHPAYALSHPPAPRPPSETPYSTQRFTPSGASPSTSFSPSAATASMPHTAAAAPVAPTAPMMADPPVPSASIPAPAAPVAPAPAPAPGPAVPVPFLSPAQRPPPSETTPTTRTTPTTTTSVTTATEAMARSIERLSGVVADLTAANAALQRDVRARDEQLAALDAENKRLAAENARLTGLVGELNPGPGTGPAQGSGQG